MVKPRGHTTKDFMQRFGQLQQAYKHDIIALKHGLQLQLGEVAQLKEQLHKRTGELDKVLAEEDTNKDEYEKAKECLLTAEEQHKVNKKEWAS